jgi:Protein of unknown function (DUF3011)
MHSMKTWLNFGFAVAIICMLAPLSSADNINCSSEDGNRHYCSVDTRGGVQMVNQRSGSPCIQGQTWGYDRGGIWVDRGCRADFVTGQSGYGGGSQTVNCSSEDGRRRYCSVDTRGGVQMIKQRSDATCIQGQTWGYDRGGIWVDRGCRADFSVGQGGYGGGGYGGGYGGGSQNVNCSSENGHRHSCPIPANSRVTLQKQRSGAPCVQGRSWGYNNREIWVDRGCRADFTVQAQGDWGRGRDWDRDRDHRGGSQADQFINCSSEDGHRKYCPVDTSRGRVQMIKQRSGSACIQGQTWGYDRGGIWVDRGCRADFQVVR